MTTASIIYLMGVSGCGKSTIGEQLAAASGGVFLDGDDFHPPANKEKMAAGMALGDDDRWPWFDRLKVIAEKQCHSRQPVFVACSALKTAYRQYLRQGGEGHVGFAWLDGSRELIEARIAGRYHEYMPASLLDSQFAALEEPCIDEGVVRVNIGQDPKDIVTEVLAGFGLG